MTEMKFNATWRRRGYRTDFPPQLVKGRIYRKCTNPMSHKPHVHDKGKYCQGNSYDRT